MKITPLLPLSIIIVLVATLTPGNGKIAGNYLDKIVHFGIFAFMSYQALKSLVNKNKITEVIIWCIVVGLLTEIMQQFIPGRNMDLYDGLANTLGIAAAFYYYKNASIDQG